MILTARWPIPDIARPPTPKVTCRSALINDRTQPPAAGEAVFPEALFAPAAVPAGDELALHLAAALSEQAKEAIGRAIAASRSPNTRRSYQVAWRAWEAWARGRGYPPMPAGAETVAEYLTARAAAGAGASTLGMALAAIAAAHGAAGETDPTRSEGVRRTAAGLRRESSGRAQRQARPLTETALAAITASTPPTALGRTERRGAELRRQLGLRGRVDARRSPRASGCRCGRGRWRCSASSRWAARSWSPSGSTASGGAG